MKLFAIRKITFIGLLILSTQTCVEDVSGDEIEEKKEFIARNRTWIRSFLSSLQIDERNSSENKPEEVTIDIVKLKETGRVFQCFLDSGFFGKNKKLLEMIEKNSEFSAREIASNYLKNKRTPEDIFVCLYENIQAEFENMKTGIALNRMISYSITTLFNSITVMSSKMQEEYRKYKNSRCDDLSTKNKVDYKDLFLNSCEELIKLLSVLGLKKYGMKNEHYFGYYKLRNEILAVFDALVLMYALQDNPNANTGGSVRIVHSVSKISRFVDVVVPHIIPCNDCKGIDRSVYELEYCDSCRNDEFIRKFIKGKKFHDALDKMYELRDTSVSTVNFFCDYITHVHLASVEIRSLIESNYEENKFRSSFEN